MIVFPTATATAATATAATAIAATATAATATAILDRAFRAHRPRSATIQWRALLVICWITATAAATAAALPTQTLPESGSAVPPPSVQQGPTAVEAVPFGISVALRQGVHVVYSAEAGAAFAQWHAALATAVWIEPVVWLRLALGNEWFISHPSNILDGSLLRATQGDAVAVAASFLAPFASPQRVLSGSPARHPIAVAGDGVGLLVEGQARFSRIVGTQLVFFAPAVGLAPFVQLTLPDLATAGDGRRRLRLAVPFLLAFRQDLPPTAGNLPLLVSFSAEYSVIF